MDIFGEIVRLMSLLENPLYETVCVKRFGECVDNSDLKELALMMDKIEEGKVGLKYPLMQNPISHKTYFFQKYFGGISFKNGNDSIRSVEAIRLTYAVINTPNGWSWIHRGLHIIQSFKDNPLLSINAITSDSIRTELTRNIVNAFYVMPQSVISTTLFTLTFSGLGGILGLASTLLASLTAFSFLSLAQISPWQAINAAGFYFVA